IYTIRSILSHGDYYPESIDASNRGYPEIGSRGIRPFAWVMLLQAGNLVKIDGNRLALTRKGNAALRKPSYEVIKDLWERWLKTKLLHELSRVEIIKGQKSKKRPLYAPQEARISINLSLSELEEGKWLRLSDFFDHMSASGDNVQIVRNGWGLYICDAHYGSLGYGHIIWEHINGRFIMAFLLEYAATLGLIDVALTVPWYARNDFSDLWGIEDCSCLSRYDGLYAIRVNSLGSYVLGNCEEFQHTTATSTSLKVLPNLEIAGDHVDRSDQIFLDRVFVRKSDNIWKITQDKLLAAVDEGAVFESIEEFLQIRNGEQLPSQVLGFLDDCRKNIGRIKEHGPAQLFECEDNNFAHLLDNDVKLKKLCMIAGDRYLAVHQQDLTKFQRVLRKQGYLIKKMK
ncbi:helicase-associated domain-containing protein, partial [bacterium]|nr:helicase-associated domain-containing protein [bacterium]